MLSRKEFEAAQIEGLKHLVDILARSEVNFVFKVPRDDMAYIEMVDTPRGPHAIYDPHTKSYDIWKWGHKRPGMKNSNLSAEDAAEILATEYFVAKAKRIRKRNPTKSLIEIIKTLRRGYQSRANKPDRVHQ